MTRREEENKKILEFLKDTLEKNPDLRFEQLIWILDQGEDRFYEEPWETLRRWKNGQ